MILWRTASGRAYVTRRHNYDDPVSKPVSEAEVEAASAVAARAATFDDPPPF